MYYRRISLTAGVSIVNIWCIPVDYDAIHVFYAAHLGQDSVFGRQKLWQLMNSIHNDT